MPCPHLLRALQRAEQRSPLRLLYGVTRGLEELGEPTPLSNIQIRDFLKLEPPDPQEPGLSLIRGDSLDLLLDENAIGRRLLRELGVEPRDLPLTELAFTEEEDDGSQILEWMKSEVFRDWLKKWGVQPESAQLFLQQERHTKPRASSLEKLYRELHYYGSVALCYWYAGEPFPAAAAASHNPWSHLCSLFPGEILREVLSLPKYQLDFRWARMSYRGIQGTDLAIWPEAAACCLQLNVVPQALHLAWCAAHLLAHPDRERLLTALQPEILGTLHPSPVTVKDGRLISEERVVLEPDDAFHRAESLLGLGRVNRWIIRPEGRLRVHASDGAVIRIELADS